MGWYWNSGSFWCKLLARRRFFPRAAIVPQALPTCTPRVSIVGEMVILHCAGCWGIVDGDHASVFARLIRTLSGSARDLNEFLNWEMSCRGITAMPLSAYKAFRGSDGNASCRDVMAGWIVTQNRNMASESPCRVPSGKQCSEDRKTG